MTLYHNNANEKRKLMFYFFYVETQEANKFNPVPHQKLRDNKRKAKRIDPFKTNRISIMIMINVIEQIK